MSQLGHVLPLAALAAVMSYGAPLLAQTIIDEWQGVKAAPSIRSSTRSRRPASTWSSSQTEFGLIAEWLRANFVIARSAATKQSTSSVLWIASLRSQ